MLQNPLEGEITLKSALYKKGLCLLSTLCMCHALFDELSVTIYVFLFFFLPAPVIPQTGLPGGTGGGAGKKAAKVPGFVDA